MMNLDLSINLLRLQKAGVVTLQGKNEVCKCVVIPIEENDIYISEENGKAKSAYLNLTAWKKRETGRFGDTHMVKQSFSSAFRESHSEEELYERPILGDGKEKETVNSNMASAVAAPYAQYMESPDDMPF